MQWWRNRVRTKWQEYAWNGWNEEVLALANKLLLTTNSEASDVSIQVVLDALAHQNKSYIKWVHLWWQKHPTHFSEFWETLKKNPRQKWNALSLEIVAYHLPIHEVPTWVQICMLNDEGRWRLLKNENYHKYLHNLTLEQALLWTKPTVYSMSQAQAAFEDLTRLVQIDQNNSTVVETALDKVKKEQISHSEPLVKKAWILSNEELSAWMDTDKKLPYWFDPINEQTWQTYRVSYQKALGCKDA